MKEENKKAISLIQYIKELSKLKENPVLSYQNYEEVIWLDTNIPSEKEVEHFFERKMEDWLIVKRPKKVQEPIIPKEIEKWIKIDTKKNLIEKINQNVEIIENENGELKKVITSITSFPELVEERDLFIKNQWKSYITEKRRTKKIQSLYDQLFKIHQVLQYNLDSFEFIVAFGFVQWKDKRKKIERHIMVKKVELVFEKEKATFYIKDGISGFEVEEDMLPVEKQLQNEDKTSIQKILSETTMNEELLQSILKAMKVFSNAIDSQSECSDTLVRPNVKEDEIPNFSISPAFILRARNGKNFQNACDKAIQQLSTVPGIVPENILRIFNSGQENLEKNDKEVIEEKVASYFPLSSNEEQERIVDLLSDSNSVLVQGPPGTGKTHTIANLVSHLLASGQRILITSQTAKALSVLKEKLPAELQSLTVSYLSGDSSSIKDLEKVVTTISLNKEDYIIPSELDLVSELEKELAKITSELNETRKAMLNIREKETQFHNLTPNYSGTTRDLVEQLKLVEDRFSWYVSDVNLQTKDEFLNSEKELIIKLIELNLQHIDIPEGYDDFEYPKIILLDEIDEIIMMFEEEKYLSEEINQIKRFKVPSTIERIEKLTLSQLEELVVDLQKYFDIKNGLETQKYPMIKQSLTEILLGNFKNWTSEIQGLKENTEIYYELKEDIDLELIDLGNVSIKKLRVLIRDFNKHIDQGGTFGNILIKPKVVKEYKEDLKEITYNGKQINKNKQIKFLEDYLKRELAENQLLEKVNSLFNDNESDIKIPDFYESNSLLIQLDIVNNIQEWRKETFLKYEFLSQVISSEESISELQKNIDLVMKTRLLEKMKNKINLSVAPLMNVVSDKTHPVYKNLIDHVAMREEHWLRNAWKKYEEYQIINYREKNIKKFELELKNLSPTIFSSFVQSSTEAVWLERIEVWNQALEFKQAQNWVKELLSFDESQLMKKYDALLVNKQNLVAEIGSKKAWIKMLNAMTESQNKHLKAWVKAVKNIGKGTGKNVNLYRGQAQIHMEKCMEAIPAWIMPIHQVFDNFEIAPNLFDVVIIDEASQSWHEALLLKYISKKVIVVGDDKQISPTVTLKEEDVKKLQIKFFEENNFDFGYDLNTKNSFFDICYILFNNTVTLREHFRCMPEIIEFSNKISYSNKPLIPLRQFKSDRLKPLKSTYLSEATREGNLNINEAEEIVSEIKRCLKNTKYDNKTIGVISLTGKEQSKYIQKLLLESVGAEQMDERRIICGDSYSFQGDERDVIFLSMVAAKGEKNVTPLTMDTYRQRFNVAVSRAKDQLWLVHSILPEEISNTDCLRYQLLNYMTEEQEVMGSEKEIIITNDFEKDIYCSILEKGYKVIPNYQVNNFSIDFVVEGENSKIAIMCDSENSKSIEWTFEKEKILQRAGWTFIHILSSRFYNDKEKAMQILWNKLVELKIQPINSMNFETQQIQLNNSMIQQEETVLL